MRATETETETVPVDESGLPPCITQDSKEPAGPEFLAICTGRGTEIEDSVHCPPECGGHPICRPCLDLARRIGLAAR